MAHLNDMQRGSGIVKDYSLVEKLVWAKMDNEIDDFVLLSYGNVGMWVFNLLNSVNGRTNKPKTSRFQLLVNGEASSRKIAHFCLALNDAEATSYTPYGQKTGRELPEKTATASIKKDYPTDAYKFFDDILDSHPVSNNDPTEANKWIQYWHIGLAAQLRFVDGRILGMYRNTTGLNDSELWSFVRANVLVHSPLALRKVWFEAHPVEPEPVKEEKPASQPAKAKTRKAKAKTTGTKAMANALETAGIASNGK